MPDHEFFVGQEVRIVGNGSSRYHFLAVGSVGTIVQLPDKWGQYGVTGVNDEGKTLEWQLVEPKDLEPVRTLEDIRREFLRLIGAEDA